MAGQREQWSNTFGFVLAAAGSAIGLGNLWKFPYITWENQGGSFVLVYLVCIALVGLPLMMAEVLVGRAAGFSPVVAYEKLARGRLGGKAWALAGWLGMFTGLLVLGFYTVIAGWSISSFLQCLNWSFNGYQPQTENDFGTFVGNGWLQVGLAFLFATITAAIVSRGISRGIERATRILMPVLMAILLLLLIQSFFLDGFPQALSFLFKPNFSGLTGHAVLEALGHAFFTLSLGMGGMITYGSYMKKTESITRAALVIVALDTLIAILACVIMYTIIFSFQEARDAMGESTVGMLFITMPKMFYMKLPAGTILAPIFFVLIGFAALSSTISMLEVVVAPVVDKLGITRKKATMGAAAVSFLITIACALSNGASGFFTTFNPFAGAESGLPGWLNAFFLKGRSGMLNVLDHFVTNWLLLAGALAVSIFVAWIMDQKSMCRELALEDEAGQPRRSYHFYRAVIGILVPILILIIIYSVNAL